MTTLDYLNRYANLLVAFVTLLLVVANVVYIFLTWRTLKALERANRKDLELEHLAEIKQTVAEPLLAWLGEVVASLKGRPGFTHGLLWVGTEPLPKRSSRIDEWPYEYEQKIKPAPTLWEPGATEIVGSGSPAGGILGIPIFFDAERRHFPDQLSQFHSFLTEWRAFLSDAVELATDCAKSLQGRIGLPHLPPQGAPEEFANADQLVASCLRQILAGAPPYFVFRNVPPGVIAVHDTSNSSQPIAQSRQGNVLRSWTEEGSRYVEEQWKERGIAGRVAHLLAHSEDIRNAINYIRLIHFLPGDCQYVSGRGPRRRTPSL